jgi:hypothetical protein
MKTILAAVMLALSFGASAQTVLNLKPLKSVWKPADVASVELRVRGRLATDPATTHRILGRVTMTGTAFDWITVLTLRATLLVPATQTWEIKSLSLVVHTAPSTGLDQVEILTRTMTVPHVAPSGQTLAIDVNSTTGVVTLGPR